MGDGLEGNTQIKTSRCRNRAVRLSVSENSGSGIRLDGIEKEVALKYETSLLFWHNDQKHSYER